MRIIYILYGIIFKIRKFVKEKKIRLITFKKKSVLVLLKNMFILSVSYYFSFMFTIIERGEKKFKQYFK